MASRRYLVCYDISDPKRLRQVAKSLQAFGRRVQYSVFECFLDTTQLAKARMELEAIIDSADDQILFVSLINSEDRDGDLVISSLGLPYIQRSMVTIV